VIFPQHALLLSRLHKVCLYEVSGIFTPTFYSEKLYDLKIIKIYIDFQTVFFLLNCDLSLLYQNFG